MPREIRKRGKRKPKKDEEDLGPSKAEPAPQDYIPLDDIAQGEPAPASAAGPSGIHPSRAALLAGRRPEPSSTHRVPHYQFHPPSDPRESASALTDPDHPFGLLHPDVKGYIHALSPQLIAWQSQPPDASSAGAGEEREDRQNFLSSVLGEIRGQELAVATDPDTALVLERLMPSLGDWGRRVLGDALAGGWAALVRQRWGSHIVQTWLTLAAGTLDREARGVWPAQHLQQEQEQAQGQEQGKEEDREGKSTGVLPSMAALVQGFIAALGPEMPTLLTHPQASPVMRTLLILLSPGRPMPSLDGLAGGSRDSLVRSKKSAKWRTSHKVQGASILGTDEAEGGGKGKAPARRLPDELLGARRELRRGITEAVQGIEWRLMGVNPVGSPTIQLLLEMEIEDSDHTSPSSLLNHLTESSLDQPKEYLASLLSSQLGSRLLETLLRVAPRDIFKQLWRTYFKGQIGRLAVHPFANFVVAKGISRLEEKGMKKAIKECMGVSGGRGMIKTSRTSVLLAFVERASDLPACQEGVLELVCSVLDVKDEKNMFVPCLMALKTLPTYRALESGQTPTGDNDDVPVGTQDDTAEEVAAAQARLDGWKNRRQPRPQGDPLAPSLQGSLLLQAMVKMGHDMVFDSLYAEPPELLVSYACSPVASHLFTTILTSPLVPMRQSKRLISALLGHYRTLAEDRSGSRIVDQVWDTADTFMRQRIAGSLVPHAMRLSENEFGKYVVRKMDLFMLERKPREWKERVAMAGAQAQRKAGQPVKVDEVRVEGKETDREEEEKTRKRKLKEERKDEIDSLFDTVKVKKQKA